MILLAGFYQILTQIKGFFGCCGYLTTAKDMRAKNKVINEVIMETTSI